MGYRSQRLVGSPRMRVASSLGASYCPRMFRGPKHSDGMPDIRGYPLHPTEDGVAAEWDPPIPVMRIRAASAGGQGDETEASAPALRAGASPRLVSSPTTRAYPRGTRSGPRPRPSM